MYTRDYPKESAQGDVPCGYGGCAFPPEPPREDCCPPPEPPCCPPPKCDCREHEDCHKPKCGKKDSSLLSRFLPGGLFGGGIKSFLSGDLLLVVLAVLLVTGDSDGCEEEDNDLWLLLLLLYFMK